MTVGNGLLSLSGDAGQRVVDSLKELCQVDLSDLSGEGGVVKCGVPYKEVGLSLRGVVSMADEVEVEVPAGVRVGRVGSSPLDMIASKSIERCDREEDATDEIEPRVLEGVVDARLSSKSLLELETDDPEEGRCMLLL